MSVTLTDDQAKNMAASLRNAANVLDPPATTPTPPPTPIPPGTNYPNFQLIFDEQFTKDCAEGQVFPSTAIASSSIRQLGTTRRTRAFTTPASSQ